MSVRRPSSQQSEDEDVKTKAARAASCRLHFLFRLLQPRLSSRRPRSRSQEILAEELASICFNSVSEALVKAIIWSSCTHSPTRHCLKRTRTVAALIPTAGTAKISICTMKLESRKGQHRTVQQLKQPFAKRMLISLVALVLTSCRFGCAVKSTNMACPSLTTESVCEGLIHGPQSLCGTCTRFLARLFPPC